MAGGLLNNAHERNVTNLTEEFRIYFSPELVQRLYDQQRQIRERDATITGYIPILAYRAAKEILKNAKNELGQLEAMLQEAL